MWFFKERMAKIEQEEKEEHERKKREAEKKKHEIEVAEAMAKKRREEDVDDSKMVSCDVPCHPFSLTDVIIYIIFTVEPVSSGTPL